MPTTLRAGEGPPGFELFAYELRNVDLVSVEGAIPILASKSATGKGRRYGEVIARALEFFARELGWRETLSLVILDASDWPKVTDVPYPAPHVFTLNKVVVMPDSLARFPGFNRWGIADEPLNEALTVHEIGHALVQRNALGWSEMTHTVDELLANVMMAGFLLGEIPELSVVLDGAPAGFSAPGSRALADLDYQYAELGLETYAWHQFELARAAGVMARAKPLDTLMPELVKALGAPRVDLPETVIGKLETVVPGVGDAFAAFAPVSRWPLAHVGDCSRMLGSASDRRLVPMVIENRTARVIEARNARSEEGYFTSLRADGKTPESDPDLFAVQPTVIPPGTFWKTDVVAGQDVLVDGVCVRAADGPSRLSVDR